MIKVTNTNTHTRGGRALALLYIKMIIVYFWAKFRLHLDMERRNLHIS